MKTIKLICDAVKQFLIVSIIMLAIPDAGYAQSATFSQFFNNPVYYNPAFTGSHPGLRVRLLHRKQWMQLSNPYDNSVLTIDIAERNIPGAGGLGIIVNNDYDGLGFVNTQSAAFAYSARVRLSDAFYTQVGISAAAVTKTIDWGRLIFSDQLDPIRGVVDYSNFVPPDYYQIMYPDFNVGGVLIYYGPRRHNQKITGTLSGAVHHLFQPDISFVGDGYKLPWTIVVSGDILIDNNVRRSGGRYRESLFDKWNPGFFFEKHQDVTSISLGMNIYRNFIYSGAWIRAQHFNFVQFYDAIMLVGIYIPTGGDTSLKIMYSYDYVLSQFRRSVGSSHEVSLIFEFDNINIFNMRDSGRTFGIGSGSGRKMDCIECSPF